MRFGFMFAFGLICAAIIIMVVKDRKSNKK